MKMKNLQIISKINKKRMKFFCKNYLFFDYFQNSHSVRIFTKKKLILIKKKERKYLKNFQIILKYKKKVKFFL